MRPFSIIVAADSKGGIGIRGTLPWNLPEDLKYFKEITSAVKHPSKKNAVIMGRKTWESLPEQFRPLPKRINIVLTHQRGYLLPADVLKFEGLPQALEYLEMEPLRKTIDNIFVIGGGQIFKEAILHPDCRKIYLTKILSDFSCDVFLPALPKDFKETFHSPPLKENSLLYFFAEYVRP